MKIKEVYHYLNTMKQWESDLALRLSGMNLICKTTEFHKKNEVIQTEQNETKEIVDSSAKHTYDDYLKLWDAIIQEKQKIYELIEKAKTENKISDTMLNINKSYRSLINSLKNAANFSVPMTTTRKETGYIKGTDGVGTYTYIVEETTSAKYENKYYIDNLDKYTKIADDISEKIDTFNTNVDIDYTPKWSIHCNLENMFE